MRVRLPSATSLVYVVLGVALLAALADLPARWAYIQPALGVARLWSDPDTQHRLQAYEGSYDLLRQADALLPPDAPVLLVTSGEDVTRLEYVAYHRALYLLAPRPVWWMTPAQPDGTWKAKWWISAPLAPEAIRDVAAGKGAQYVLYYHLNAPTLAGAEAAELPGGNLARLEGSAPFRELARPRPDSGGPFWPFQVIAAVIVIFLIGTVPVALVTRLGYKSSAIEGLGLSWLLGCGVTSLLIFLLSGLGLGLGTQMPLLTLAAVAWAAFRFWGLDFGFWISQLKKPSQNPKSKVQSPKLVALHWALFLFLAVQVGLVALLAVGRPMEVWDSWVNWGMKANIIFLEGGVTPALYADTSRTVTQLDYPLYVPATLAWLYGWLGAIDDRLAGVPSLLYYLVMLGVFYGALRAWGGGRTLALAATATLGTMWNIAGLAGLVFADAALVALVAVAGLYAHRWLAGGPPGTLLLAALAGGFLPWTKREGAVILVALCLAILLVRWRTARAWALVGVLAAGALLFAGPWYGLMAATGIVNTAFSPITLETLQANLDRVGTIADLTWKALLHPGLSYIWPLYFGFWIIDFGLRRVRNPKSRMSEGFLPLAALIYVLLSGFVYIFSAFVPFEQHVLSSVDRLVAQVTPLVLLWVVLFAVPSSD